MLRSGKKHIGLGSHTQNFESISNIGPEQGEMQIDGMVKPVCHACEPRAMYRGGKAWGTRDVP